MKKFILIISMMIGGVILTGNIQAQNVSVNVNINSQPSWGPVGYNFVEFYFIPEINVYFIVNSGMFVFFDGRRWVTSRFLPPRYRHFDLYSMHKVVLVGGSRTPWIHNRTHIRNYARFRNHRGQPVIRDSRSPRYRNSRRNIQPWYQDPNQSRRDSRNDIRNAGNDRINNNRPSTSTRVETNTNDRRGTNDRATSNSTQRNNRPSSESSNRGR